VAAAMLSVVPLFLLLSVFAGGMYLAIDSMAGERERGSLEPLLLNPVTRAQVVLGKWGAVVLASWAALGIAITGFSIALRHVPLQDLGVRAQLGSHEILGAMLVLMPLGFFASALQMVLALFARTYKEAQTYLSLMMIIPMLPAAFLSISPVEGKAWMMLVPVLGHTVLLNEVLRGDAIHYSWAAIAAVVAIAAAALSALWAQRMLSQEKIIFGRGAGA
jgi:sodium transport system permease protein